MASGITKDELSENVRGKIVSRKAAAKGEASYDPQRQDVDRERRSDEEGLEPQELGAHQRVVAGGEGILSQGEGGQRLPQKSRGRASRLPRPPEIVRTSVYTCSWRTT